MGGTFGMAGKSGMLAVEEPVATVDARDELVE